MELQMNINSKIYFFNRNKTRLTSPKLKKNNEKKNLTFKVKFETDVN